jgi:integrase
MRTRYQKGSLSKRDGAWIAQWWEDGHRRKRTLGRISRMTKAQAETELANILAPINNRQASPSGAWKFCNFLTSVYLPFYRRKWKRSTAMINEDRLRCYLTSVYAQRTLGSFDRDELQEFLERKALSGLSYSVVAHLRWDLRQIFRMAVSEGHIARNPAELLFIPRKAKRPERKVLNIKEVNQCIQALDRRESLIIKLAVLGGMRPGEIFALKCGCLSDMHAQVQQRVYRGEIDSPKTANSVRAAALPEGLLDEIKSWIADLPDSGDNAWVFPSETMKTPLGKDNVWRRSIAPKLKQAGLEWVDFHVLRRTHSTLMNELGVDPKVVSDQLGHTLDVNQNVYTQASLRRRKLAVDALENTLADQKAVNGAEMEQAIRGVLASD